MIFDTVDYEVLKLAGVCRYFPFALKRRFNSELLSSNTIDNLKLHNLIKSMNDHLSFKLTKKGRECLADIGYEFTQDARTDIKKASYFRKLENAKWNVLLTIAGIDVYYSNARTLADTEKGYISTLAMRTDKNMKVLAGSKFLGVLKDKETAYVPYYVKDRESWIYPFFERTTYRSQIESMRSVNEIKLILTGETLEELWGNITTLGQPPSYRNGMMPFSLALEELGSEFLLVPLSDNGVMQMRLLLTCRYRERLASAIGCKKNIIPNLSECDGFKNDTPYIIAIDFNVKRIVRALRQIEKYDKNLVPRICCLPFQKNCIMKLLKEYNSSKTIVTAIPKDKIYVVFPELKINNIERKAYTKDGECIEIPGRKLTEDEEAIYSEDKA